MLTLGAGALVDELLDGPELDCATQAVAKSAGARRKSCLNCISNGCVRKKLDDQSELNCEDLGQCPGVPL